MANIYGSIYTHFSTSPLFAGVPIHYGNIPQSAVYPCLRFSLVSIVYMGVSHGGAGLRKDRVQFDGVGQYIDDAAPLRSRVFELINNFSGIMGGGLRIQSCLPLGVGGDSYDDVRNVHLARQDWEFEYTEEGE